MNIRAVHKRIGKLIDRFRKAKTGIRALIVIGIVILFYNLIFLILNLVYPLPVQKLNRPQSIAVYSEGGELLNVHISRDDFWRIQCDLDDIPVFARKTLINYEDRWFYVHPGFNPVALVRAFISNIREGKTVSGGSTITMQVARIIEPKPRTLKSKVIELFRAIQLERRYSKNEILEFYFNLAPYGGNIEGIGSASWFYFGKPPSMLSKSEILALVGLPNSPARLRPDIHPNASRNHRDKLARLMMNQGLISQEDCADIISDPVPETRIERPQNALHIGEYAKSRYGHDAQVKTTIDYRMQLMCENLLKTHVQPLMDYEITNGAIVIIENKTRKVKAMVGSRDFFDSVTSGQVNGALAPRSPGSALKPFIYAAAIDEGLVSPKIMLNDVPVNYSGYKPVNYDRKYRGGVSMEDALKDSLNVPAVNLHYQMNDRFYRFLKDAGITTLDKPWEHYGLPIVLGGCEVNLLELTNLYASLACGGVYQPYILTGREEYNPPKQIISPEASYIISEILADINRPELPNCWEYSINQTKIAWKTGTSYGNHDAWSIGYNPDFTVGIWIGNFSGKESEKLIGKEVAAPLLFDIFNLISDGSSWFQRPESVGEREVCSLSGMIATYDCPHKTREFFIPGISPVKTCQMHKSFIIDDQTGLLIADNSSFDENKTRRIYEIWPASIASWRKLEGYPVDELPEFLSQSRKYLPGFKPIINSPMDDACFELRRGIPLEHQKILLRASVPNTVRQLYWFVDGKLLETCNPNDSVFYSPEKGKHRIACMDNNGNAETVEIKIL
jgi:penicillin-binding protein 1C